jgi:hypothetical protein
VNSRKGYMIDGQIRLCEAMKCVISFQGDQTNVKTFVDFKWIDGG